MSNPHQNQPNQLAQWAIGKVFIFGPLHKVSRNLDLRVEMESSQLGDSNGPIIFVCFLFSVEISRHRVGDRVNTSPSKLYGRLLWSRDSTLLALPSNSFISLADLDCLWEIQCGTTLYGTRWLTPTRTGLAFFRQRVKSLEYFDGDGGGA